jgi:hypothetical protein
LSPSAEAVLADLAAEAAVEAGAVLPFSAPAPRDILRDVPSPGYFYRIRKGDTLLGIAGRAYQVAVGTQARLDLARRINRHPLNRKYLRTQSASGLFPEGLISFFPHFTCDPDALMWSAGPPARGGCFAVIYIPARETTAHPMLGPSTDVPAAYLAERLRLMNQRMAAGASVMPSIDEILEEKIEAGLAIVPDPLRTPFRFVCSLILVGKNPTDPHLVLLNGPASGSVIGTSHILTAAHVVGARAEDGVLHSDPVLVTPAADSPYKYKGLPETTFGTNEIDLLLLQSSPFGYVAARKSRFDSRYTEADEHAHLFDYAVMKVDAPIGTRRWGRGLFGHWAHERFGDGTIMMPHKSRVCLEDETVYLSGYPRDPAKKLGPTQILGGGKVDNDHAELGDVGPEGRQRIGYDIPTMQGHSGAPVWRVYRACGRVVRSLVAVHSARLAVASGVLLTRAMRDQIAGWIKSL